VWSISMRTSRHAQSHAGHNLAPRALQRSWIRPPSLWRGGRREHGVGGGAFDADEMAIAVVVCLVLLTLSVLTVAVSSVAMAMLSPLSTSPAPTQATTAPDRAGVGPEAERPAAASPGGEATTDPPTPPVPHRADAGTSFGNGTYVVGVDVKPGVYRTGGPGSTGICIWERLKDTSGETSAVIATGSAQGPTSVTIKETNGAFGSQYCLNWTKVN
jgi:hypothetical protein